ncbi:MAG: ABC transporter ATP-binding protein/permease [Gammaproteobacteria bacterium]|nr:ABC transporter ATP-binding protein/permease [Gammaproteobacteria bacterium]
MNGPADSFNRKTWGRCAAHINVFAGSSDVGTKAKVMSLLLVALLLGINGLNVLNSYVGRDFMTAIANRDQLGFLRQAVFWLGVFASSTLVAVFARYFEERLGLLWRNFSTRRVLGGYMTNRTYYRLAAAGEIENPDQRIADDIRTFTTTTLSYLIMLLNGSITAVAFSGVLWSISPLLLIVAVAYAAAGSFLTVGLGGPLMRLNFQQLDKEGKFRTNLVHVKENTHLVAISQREGYLCGRLMGHLSDLTANFERIIRVNRNVGFFTTGYNWLIQLIPIVIIAPLYMGGAVEFGVVTQAAAAFMQLVGAFSLIVTQFQSISSFAAVVARMDALVTAIEDGAEDAHPGVATVEDEHRVAFVNLSLQAPGQNRLLVRDLTFELGEARRVLVLGSDETAVSALFRAAAGLWIAGSGTIVRPSFDHIMFLSERPYLPPGPLNDLLLRPRRADCGVHLDHQPERRRSHQPGGQRFPETRVKDVLGLPGIGPLLERVSALQIDHEWDTVLTLGEQQLLVCARLLLAAPHFAFLERPSTTLEGEPLDEVLRTLRSHAIGYAVFEQEATNLEPYDTILELLPGGAWNVRRLDTAA